MSKTQKTVSDLLEQLSEKVIIATEVDAIRTAKLGRITCHILKESSMRKQRSKSLITLASFSISFLTDKKKYENQVRAQKRKINQKESFLGEALKRIQRASARRMFFVLDMNMKYGPEKTIKYVLESFPKTKTLEIDGMTFLVDEVKVCSKPK